MPTVRIPPGVVRAETRNVVPGRWHEANLIRWQGDRMIPVGGYERITPQPLQHVPRNGFVWNDMNIDRHMSIICDDAVFYAKASEYIDITPDGFLSAANSGSQGYGSGLYGVGDYSSDDEPRGPVTDVTTPIFFSMDNFGSELIFSSSADGRIFVFDPNKPINRSGEEPRNPHVAENAPTFAKAVIVTEEGHVMCFGDAGQPNRVSWSDQDNRAGWDFARVEGQAGFIDLEGAGVILCAHKIPGGILVFTSSSVWIGRYIGAPYFYGFNKISDGSAPISAHAVAVAGARAFWMGNKNFWKYEGGVVSVLPHPLGPELFNEIHVGAPRRVFAGFNGLYPEIWFFYPSNRDGQEEEGAGQVENDRYVIFSIDGGWWADGWMARTFMTYSAIDTYPIAGSAQTHVFRHERGWTNAGAPRDGEIYAEVSALSLGGGEVITSVHQCQIDNAEGVDAVSFDFRGSYSRGGEVYDLQLGLVGRPDGYLDTHFSARDFSMKVTGIKDVPWGLGAMLFSKVKGRGGR